MQSKAHSLSLPTMICMVVLFCAAAVPVAPAQSIIFTSLYSFCPAGSWPCHDGTGPYAGLVQATDGNFYGTTLYGGANTSYGTVFKITNAGALTQLYNLCSQPNCTDGALPYAGLVQASDGNFYGTTEYGGTGISCPANYFGCGTVFKITPEGTLTTVYSFCGQPNCTDGLQPYAALVQGSDGNLYGTTYQGGTGDNCASFGQYGCGTIFKITPAGLLTTLHSFDAGDGASPMAGLVQGSDGNLYGTTLLGGRTNNCSYPIDGCGTVFKISPAGLMTTLYNFCSQPNCTDGRTPEAGLVQATDGNFYGTTQSGGTSDDGTVFKITPAGTLTTLHSFCSHIGCSDGWAPCAGLVQASDGNFYGTTEYGGVLEDCGGTGCGTVFKITSSGTLTALHSFNDLDGAYPFARLVQAIDGNFYGTTIGGGAYGFGTVFRLTVARACATCRP